MDGTYPSFASRVSCVAHTLPVDFAVRSAQRCRFRAAARATSTETGGYLPAVSWPLACCRVNLQWATSPMKQEKCIQTGGASDGHFFKRGWRGYLLAWLARDASASGLSWNKQNAPCFVKAATSGAVMYLTCTSFNARELCWQELRLAGRSDSARHSLIGAV